MTVRHLPRGGRVVLLLLGCLLGGLLAPPVHAGSYPETGRPVYLGMGGATFGGGSVDAGSGAALLPVTFGKIFSVSHVPIAAGFLWKGQDNSPGPFGPGTYMLYDWFLQPVNPGTLAPCELVGPGNRRFSFGTQDQNFNWIDTRDPEMLGAVLHIPNPPLSNQQNWLVWKDGTTWYFLGGGSNGLFKIVDAHGSTLVYTTLRDITTGIATTIQLTSSTSQRTISYTIPWAHTEVASVTISYDGGGTGSPNRTWNIAYDINGRLSTITDPLGGVSRYTWTTYTRDDNQVVPLLASVTNPRCDFPKIWPVSFPKLWPH